MAIENSNIKQLYLNNIAALNAFRDCYHEYILHGPLLLNIDKYFTQKIKLMVVGQETYGWSTSGDVETLIAVYERFNFGASYVSSPFWSVIRKIERSLEVEPYAIAWSNLNRFDVNTGSPDRTVLAKPIATIDYLLKAEIDILTPDVCILFTNHKYDKRLEALYDGIHFENIEGLPNKHFASLHHPDLPKHTIRAPHPRTIRMMKWEDAFIKEIRDINQLITDSKSLYQRKT